VANQLFINVTTGIVHDEKQKKRKNNLNDKSIFFYVPHTVTIIGCVVIPNLE